MKSKQLTQNLKTLPAKLLGLSLALLSLQSVGAQTWQTVLDYQLVPGKTADGDGIVADASGNVFSGGNGNDASGTYHGIVLKTDTTQANWYFSNDTNPSFTQDQSYLWSLGLDSGGNLYSIGQLTPNSTGIPYWYVRKSSDKGLSWSTVDLYQYAAGQWVDAAGFTADNSGNVYVVGGARDAGTKRNPVGNLHWLVRKSANGGPWTVVNDVQGSTPGFVASGAAFVAGAGVFVVGGPNASASSLWVVRRSLNGELSTWSTLESPFAGGAAAVGSDSTGNIYVTGAKWITTATKPNITGYWVWVTRESNDGGNHWSTVDTFAPAQNKNSNGLGVGRDSGGHVVVVGYAYDAQAVRHWIVRTPGSYGAWGTIDDFHPGNSASALGVVTDAAGNLLVTGAAQDATGSHWIVRKLAP
jgi:hypothetical protein